MDSHLLNEEHGEPSSFQMSFQGWDKSLLPWRISKLIWKMTIISYSLIINILTSSHTAIIYSRTKKSKIAKVSHDPISNHYKHYGMTVEFNWPYGEEMNMHYTITYTSLHPDFIKLMRGQLFYQGKSRTHVFTGLYAYQSWHFTLQIENYGDHRNGLSIRSIVVQVYLPLIGVDDIGFAMLADSDQNDGNGYIALKM